MKYVPANQHRIYLSTHNGNMGMITLPLKSLLASNHTTGQIQNLVSTAQIRAFAPSIEYFPEESGLANPL